MTGCTVCADAADHRQNHVLGREPGRQVAVEPNLHRPGLLLHETLRGKHVLHLTRADAQGESAKRAVRGSVRVAADDGHSGLGRTKFRPYDVHDALVGRIEIEERQTERTRVAGQGADLLRGNRVGNGEVPVAGRHVVVDGGKRALGTPHPTTGEPQPLERLGRGDFVHQVQVDVQQRGPPGHRMDHVGIPDLLEEGTWLSHHTVAGSRAFATAAAFPSSLHGIITRRVRPVCSSRWS